MDCKECGKRAEDIWLVYHKKSLVDAQNEDLKFRNAVLEEKCKILENMLINKEK